MIAVKIVFGQFLHCLYNIRLPVAFLWPSIVISTERKKFHEKITLIQKVQLLHKNDDF